ncbi:helix-turn-helix domain-containing protein [Desertibacillus haloalkaliphilus]|uniref:helix-turn-helix domain-containing protein n=1 Tax=Desertibacillus haloalkaliphilus TaxID=1328930 RepID=UPI001FE99953|nr:helix-turn-helix domain-containing protein [Desertibacillus haloalkaliphilus]
MSLTWAIYDVMTAAEAETTWGLAKGTVRVYANNLAFNDDEARKSAGTWLVTNEGMTRVFGSDKRCN